MSRAEENWYDCRDMEDIPGTNEYLDNIYPYIKYIDIDWFVKSKRYCSRCWNTDIKISQKWKLYCSKICRKNK